MATKYLARGSITATGTWSSANPVTADDLIVNDDFGPLVNDVSAYGGVDLESLVYKPGAVGRFGGGTAGGFTASVDNTADAKIVMEGTDVVHYQAADANNVDVNAGNVYHAMAGTHGTITQSGGEVWGGGGAVITNFYNAAGGISDHGYNATKGTIFEVSSGTHNIRREYATIKVRGNAVVIIDLDDQISVDAATELHIDGGTVILINGAIPIVYGNAGKLDNRKARKSFELGATTLQMLGTYVQPSTRVTMTNQSSPGAMDRPVSSPIQVA